MVVSKVHLLEPALEFRTPLLYFTSKVNSNIPLLGSSKLYEPICLDSSSIAFYQNV